MEGKGAGTSGLVAVEGTKLGYLIEGTGIPCLAVGSTIFYPPTFSEELRRELRFIFADTRFIRSPSEAAEYERITLDTLLDDIEQIRRASGMDKVAVLGHSAMGVLALEYARKHAQHVTHVVMIGTPAYALVSTEGPSIDFAREVEEFWEADASEERKAILERNQRQLTEERLSEVPPGKAFGASYVARGPMVWFDPTYDASWLFERIEFDSGALDHFLGVILKNYDIGKTLRQVTAPVFLALGRYDYLVPYGLWDAHKDSVPNLSYHLFEKSGHYPMMEEAALFDQELIEWMKGA